MDDALHRAREAWCCEHEEASYARSAASSAVECSPGCRRCARRAKPMHARNSCVFRGHRVGNQASMPIATTPWSARYVAPSTPSPTPLPDPGPAVRRLRGAVCSRLCRGSRLPRHHSELSSLNTVAVRRRAAPSCRNPRHVGGKCSCRNVRAVGAARRSYAASGAVQRDMQAIDRVPRQVRDDDRRILQRLAP